MTRRKTRLSDAALDKRLRSLAEALIDAVPDKLPDADLQHIARLLALALDHIGREDDAGPGAVDMDAVRARLAVLIESRTQEQEK
jgi:hypothetical protein